MSLTRVGTPIVVSIGLTACVAGLLPAVLVPQMAATVGVAGLAAVSCTGNTSCDPGPAQCSSQTDTRFQVAEALDIDIPANEGTVATFSPAYWQPQFVSPGASLAARGGEVAPGTFAITDKSIVFAASPGSEGVHLPLIGVVNVELQQNAATGAPRQVTIESCFGRLDRFTFGQTQQPRQLDSKATAEAAAEIKARISRGRTPVRD
jgi:hypothetical protein